MARPGLQDCPNGCGRRHYGAPTATNCPRYSTGPLGATKNDGDASLPVDYTGLLDDLDKKDFSIDPSRNIGDLLSEHEMISVSDEGTLEQGRHFPPEQGSYGDPDEFIAAMTEGTQSGWKAISGKSNQHGYSGPLMHPSEDISDAWSNEIKHTPGDYAVVSVDDDSGYGGEPESVGWMLLRRTTPQQRAIEERIADTRRRTPGGVWNEPGFDGDSEATRGWIRSAVNDIAKHAGNEDADRVDFSATQATVWLNEEMDSLEARKTMMMHDRSLKGFADATRTMKAILERNPRAAQGLKDSPETRLHNLSDRERSEFEEAQRDRRALGQRLRNRYGTENPRKFDNDIERVNNNKKTLIQFAEKEAETIRKNDALKEQLRK